VVIEVASTTPTISVVIHDLRKARNDFKAPELSLSGSTVAGDPVE